MTTRLAVLLLASAGVAHAQAPRGGRAAEPPNAPARVVVAGDSIELRYRGRAILAGRLASSGPAARLRVLVDSSGGKVTQVVSWTANGGRLVLRAVAHGSADAFAVDPDPREDGVPIVRHSVGPSYSLLNRGVYARGEDWLLSLDVPAAVRIEPVAGGDSSAFLVEAAGGEVTIRFRPRYYQKHRGLKAYAPWAFTPKRASVAGWTSWYAFRDRITEGDVHAAVDAIAERLAPFGYEYVQIDDGFQQLPIGVPDHWLNTNDKFPGGIRGMRDAITGRGLKAGLWTNVAFADTAYAESHARYFVRTPDGKPAWGNWVGFVMDGANPATMRDLVLPVYRQLKAQGWSYYKVDALRHLRYEGYNSHAPFYRARGIDRVGVYRSFVQQIREVIGRDAFLLASWGPRPELIGIVDATRLGDDGFGYGGFSQFNSFNNVVWRNDPDHIEIGRDDGYRATTLTSLTGALLMLTDKPDVYRGDRVEAARRAAPVPFTLPGQAYDIDPSRSDRLFMADHEVSGSGPRPFEADQRLQQALYQVDVARPFERWTVLARTAGAPDSLSLSDLGLAVDQDYVAFDFWRKRDLGVVRGALVAGAVDPTYQVQVVCLRPRLAHPQLLSTNRHLSCGAVDLADVRWTDGSLSGVSTTVLGDDYVLYLSERDGWVAASVEVDRGEGVLGNRIGAMRSATIRRPPGGAVRWTVRYRRG